MIAHLRKENTIEDIDLEFHTISESPIGLTKKDFAEERDRRIYTIDVLSTIRRVIFSKNCPQKKRKNVVNQILEIVDLKAHDVKSLFFETESEHLILILLYKN